MRRREFLKKSAMGTVVMGLPLSKWQLLADSVAYPDVVVVRNGEPVDLVQNSLAALGGISRFVARGDQVLIKPNMGWDRSPELAANTNPDVVAELTRQCFAAGAGSVKVLDRTCNEPQRCYRNSGIAEAAEAAGADIVQIRRNRFSDLPLEGTTLRSWPIYQDYLDADKVINVPIAKHHGMARVTLGLKNLMGVMGGIRGSLHMDFAQKMADINQHILPTLTIIDAYRILVANGPSGGNPADVRIVRSMIASPCTVAADVVGLELFKLQPADVAHIQVAMDRGLASCDLGKLNIMRIDLA